MSLVSVAKTARWVVVNYVYGARITTMIVTLIADLLRPFLGWWRNITAGFLNSATYAAKRIVVCVGLLIVTLWLSVLLYASFYHFYVPSASVVRPAHFTFRVCPDGMGMCSFPMANVTLSTEKRTEVLGRGQQYKVFLEIKLPDSEENRNVGMFMIICRMYDRYGFISQESSRAVTVQYQSDLLKLIQTIALSPLYITGFAEQAQTLKVELFDSYWDDFYHPAVGVLLEIHSRHLSFYSAKLQLHACYAGLRYYLFYYPLTSAFFGILFNCTWLALAFLVTWYKLGIELLDGPQLQPLPVGTARNENLAIVAEEDLGGGAMVVRNRRGQRREAVREVGGMGRRQGALLAAGDGDGFGADFGEADEQDAPRSYVQTFTITPTVSKRVEVEEIAQASSTVQSFSMDVFEEGDQEPDTTDGKDEEKEIEKSGDGSGTDKTEVQGFELRHRAPLESVS